MPTLCGGGGGESGLRQPNSTVKGSKRRARQTQRQQERADGTRAGGSEMEDREQQKRWKMRMVCKRIQTFGWTDDGGIGD